MDYLDSIRIVGLFLIVAPILLSLLIFILTLVNVYGPISSSSSAPDYSFGLFIFTGFLMVMYASFMKGKEESMSKLEKLKNTK